MNEKEVDRLGSWSGVLQQAGLWFTVNQVAENSQATAVGFPSTILLVRLLPRGTQSHFAPIVRCDRPEPGLAMPPFLETGIC
jgi:hypothetical protein